MNNPPLRIGFIHPDLGIGGGERLVLDAALQLQRAGHKVTLFVGHHDRNHCFEETRDGTLDVRVCRFFLPGHIAQRLRAACAIARMSSLAAAAALRGSFDIIFCDLIPHVIPVLWLLSRAKIVFYCHYPERTIAPRGNFFYQLYRAPIDKLEEIGVRMADRVLFNSRFTASQFREAYPRLRAMPGEVVSPGVDPTPYEALTPAGDQSERGLKARGDGNLTFLTINRFVRYKNIGLAIEALALLRGSVPAEIFKRLQLVVVGGYDLRSRECREVLGELKATAQKLSLRDHIVFKPSCGDSERMALLAGCLCFVYTPDHEHFGIGPLEAMAAGRPVVAVRSGGPLETVLDGETGLLCDASPRAFANAMLRFISDPAEADRMGRAGRRHVRDRFSLSAFGHRLERILNDVAGRSVTRRDERTAFSG